MNSNTMATRNTIFFNYDEMTWDAVADLPRDTPLVLPLGSGYNLSLLADQLANPPRIGLLPAFPFGWRGSGLELPEPIFFQYIVNLLNSLRDDGFTRVYCLTPQGLDPQSMFLLYPASFVLAQPHDSTYAPRTFLPPDTECGKVILIPIGHTEQHGYHLPLSVDTIIIDSIAQGTASLVPTRSWAMPVMPYGVSTHRSSFAATMNAGGRAFEDFWVAVIDILAARGFDRFYLMSGHGGNSSFLVNIVKYAGERHRRIFCATAWLHTSGKIGSAALEKYRTSQIGGMGHACELETSYLLHLRPDLCQMERAVDETDFVSTPDYYMDWIEGGSLIANPPWDDDTKTGAYGAGSHGTAEKGRLWLEAAIAEKAAHVEEIHEQHERREKRRNEGYGLWGKFKKNK
ncbi:MAG: creatininase family protein [Anaerolineales bacterium]|uniref:creatininase family protein n=1 Tax=Candidatus Villigracilis proximus TaxID=3140683 RepID=UPI003134B4FD|nr:creatininase family protein [Anaerolineales bacterium]